MPERTRDAGFEGKVALVTGAASGIGKATSAALAERGARVVLADLDLAAAQRAVDGLAAHGERVAPCALDVTSEEAWRVAVAGVLERFGRLDVLVNNAGVSAAAPLDETSLADWRRVMAVNLEGPFLGLRAVGAARERAGGGAVVNVASASGHKALAGAGAYCTSKAGLLMLTRVAALELAPHGIRVNSVSPAGVETPIPLPSRTCAPHASLNGSATEHTEDTETHKARCASACSL